MFSDSCRPSSSAQLIFAPWLAAQACTPGDPGADLRCRGRPGAVPWVCAAAALPGGPGAVCDHPEVCARLAGAAMVPARTAVRA